MSKQRRPGLYKRGKIWHIRKRIDGIEIKRSTGTSKLKEAEIILENLIQNLRKEITNPKNEVITFRVAATRFINENISLKSIVDYAQYIKQLDPYSKI